MSKSTTLRDYRFDYLKAIAIIFVFWGHIISYTFTDGMTSLPYNIIYAIQMPLFMFIGGYFATSENFLTGKEAARKILIRAAAYLTPFLSWFYFVRILLLGELNRDILAASIALIQDVQASYWYLWVTFILSATFILGDCLFNKGKSFLGKYFRLALFVGGMLFLWVAVCVLCSPSFLGAKFILYYSLFFGSGYLVRKNKKYIGTLLKHSWFFHLCLWTSLLIFGSIIVTTSLYQDTDSIKNTLLRIVAGFTGIITLGMLCTKARSSSNGKFQRATLSVGRNTLEIYVVHIILYQYILKHPITIHSVGFFTAISAFLVNSLVVGAGTFLIIMIFKTNPVTDFIFFGKRK